MASTHFSNVMRQLEGTIKKCDCRKAHRGPCWVCTLCGLTGHTADHCKCLKCGNKPHEGECWYCDYCAKYGHTIDYCRSVPRCGVCKHHSHTTEEHKECAKCGKVGHTDEQCGVCRHCGSTNHLARDCDVPCTHCNKIGHHPDKCFTCTSCGGRGHADETSRDCENNPNVCQKCGYDNHVTADCRYCNLCEKLHDNPDDVKFCHPVACETCGMTNHTTENCRGVCRRCNTPGHQEWRCNKKPCCYCKKIGHEEAKCWENPNNKKSEPKKFQGKKGFERTCECGSVALGQSCPCYSYLVR